MRGAARAGQPAGMADSSARVYGMPRALEHVVGRARSRRSCPRYITSTRSHEQPHHVQVVGDEEVGHARAARRRSASSCRITACTETSSAAVGSSSTSSVGSSAMARAMPTRAFWPPESWCGIAAEQLARQADQLGQLVHPLGERGAAGQPARAAAADRRWCRNAVKRGFRLSVGILEHHLDPRALGAWRRTARRHVAEMLAVEEDAPGGRIDQPRDQPHQRRLAAARLADQAHALAAPDGEADVVDRVQRTAVVRARTALDGEALRQTSAHVEQRAHQAGSWQRDQVVAAAQVRRAAAVRGRTPASMRARSAR